MDEALFCVLKGKNNAGEPDKDEFAGQGMYATYEKRHIVFGYNKGMQLFDVRSAACPLFHN
ncbi:DUF4309 domain-containing protein [Paenibacillus thiaminolyticus]|uniref:DUF4309 domain-containing protein n=1 Tax=Paenibacillus thiaminolyticus TaxID=49283 RepID=UPI0036F1CC5F